MDFCWCTENVADILDPYYAQTGIISCGGKDKNFDTNVTQHYDTIVLRVN